MSTRELEEEAAQLVRRVHREALPANVRMFPVDAGFIARITGLIREAADQAASPYEAIRGFSLDMCEIRCPRCDSTSYPDSMGEAMDWAMGGHECNPEDDQ